MKFFRDAERTDEIWRAPGRTRENDLLMLAQERGYSIHREVANPRGDRVNYTDEHGRDVILVAQSDTYSSVWIYIEPDNDGDILLAPYGADAVRNNVEREFEDRLTEEYDTVPDDYAQGLAWRIK